MADKAISELVSAEQITATDMFVLEQNGTAKKLTGQVLLNWLTAAADGHGGIQSYTLLKTEGLVKTYRFTLADQSYMDIQVTDGRGINSISKTGTSGLVDTYQITYNDGSNGTFTVTNGAKGDTGDNAYIGVKYASQEPTASSHSFGDIPDAWIGVYYGTSATAPTDWQQYKWYKWKGEKGDTGDPATLVKAEVTYQAGTSGTVIPSGAWSSSIPSVVQGQYLWTKTVQQFNTGNPITAYSVSRMGLDGLGAVVTVNNVSPDGSGNVALDAASVKALAITGGTMEGGINMNGQKLSGLNEPKQADEAVNKGYVDTNKVAKSSVVNNFTTVDEGFVADARALAILNGSKLSAVGSEDHPGCYYRTVDGVTEWINPPMVSGVEYRTTERYNGNVVYKKLIHYRNSETIGSTSTTTNITIPHGIDNLGALVRCVCSTDNITFPLVADGRTTGVVNVDATNINLRIVKDTWSARSWYFNLAYTKTT